MLITFKRYDYVEVNDLDFYNEVFKLDQDYLQYKDDSKGQYKTNPIAIGFNNKKVFKRIMFKDDFENNLKELQSADFSILSGLTYFGRSNTMSAASKAFAIIFDIDDVGEKELGNYLHGIKNKVYPEPTFIVMSGSGIHSYFVLDQPIDLYPKTKTLLKELKFQLTDLMWNFYTSANKNKQFQGISQGFRIVGSKTKKGKIVRAFKSPSGTVSLEYLNSFVKRVDLDFSQLYKESSMSITEAKEKYPDWYENIVVKGLPKGTWTTHEGLYNWWLNKIKKETTYGHRYYAIMALAIYAIKSNIDYDQLKKDALFLMPIFNEIALEPFTEFDINSALECYDLKYKRFPRADIEKITAITIPKNKRNYQNRKDHLEVARAIRDVKMKQQKKVWWNEDGRPLKKEIVSEWRKNNPIGTKAECKRDTGLDPKTIRKWWS